MAEQQNRTEQSKTVKPKKRSGGQPGNQNARKHGFYSVIRTDVEKAQLVPASIMEGIDAEIATLRVKIASILRNDPHNMKVLIRAVSAVSSLLRTRHTLEVGDTVQVRAAMQKLLKMTRKMEKESLLKKTQTSAIFGASGTSQEMP